MNLEETKDIKSSQNAWPSTCSGLKHICQASIKNQACYTSRMWWLGFGITIYINENLARLGLDIYCSITSPKKMLLLWNFEGVKFHLYHIWYNHFLFFSYKILALYSFDSLFLIKYYQTWFQVKNTGNKNLVYTKNHYHGVKYVRKENH